MEESVTYQKILRQGREEGRAEEAVAILLRQAGNKFGAPSESQVKALRAITDLARLESLGDRILDVSDWDEWLAGSVGNPTQVEATCVMSALRKKP